MTSCKHILERADSSPPSRQKSAEFPGDEISSGVSNLYPGDTFVQDFVTKILKIYDLHKTMDPFMGKSGPEISGYGLNRLPLGFYVNVRGEMTDLLVFNLRAGGTEQYRETGKVANLSD